MNMRNILVAAALFLVGCGSGGGGDDDFVGAGNLTLSVTPRQVDTGDQILVKVNVTEVHAQGVALKVRYPSELSYVADTSFLTIGDSELDIAPNVEIASENNLDTYLIYFLNSPAFIQNGGELTVQLRADSILDEGEIEVDADINTDAFDVSNPQFTAQDSASIEVKSEE